MGVSEILSAIWALPWYKALAVAVISDAMFMITIWPIYIVAAIIVIAAGIAVSKRKSKIS